MKRVTFRTPLLAVPPVVWTKPSPKTLEPGGTRPSLKFAENVPAHAAATLSRRTIHAAARGLTAAISFRGATGTGKGALAWAEFNTIGGNIFITFGDSQAGDRK